MEINVEAKPDNLVATLDKFWRVRRNKSPQVFKVIQSLEF